MNEIRTIKLRPALFLSYIGCVIGKSSTELQSRHLGNGLLFYLAHKRCLHIYLFISNKWLCSPQRACRLMVIALALLASVHLVHLLLLIKTKCARHHWRAKARITPLPGDN